jgi:hypothetical protein
VIDRVKVTPNDKDQGDTYQYTGNPAYHNEPITRMHSERKMLPQLAKTYKKFAPMKRLEPKGGPPETGTGKGSPEDKRDY